MICPPKKTARLLPHCQGERNIMGACVPSGITPFLCVICDFISFLHQPSGSRPVTRRANTNIMCWVSLVGKNLKKKMHELQGFIKRLRFPVQKPQRRRERVTDDVHVWHVLQMPVRRLSCDLKCLVWYFEGDTKWKMTRGLPEVISVQNVRLGQTLTELMQSIKK